jgi:general secretion pathway protein M
MALDLPTGWVGRLLALSLTVVALGALWVGAAVPLRDWYANRAEQLENRHAIARRMAVFVEMLPELRHQAQVASASGKTGAEETLEGASDAIAGAALQERLQEMAARAGAPLSSAEALPGEAAGAYRRIGVRVSASAQWPALVRLLQAVAQASPRMLADDLQLRTSPQIPRSGLRPMEASFTVLAFRTASPQTAAGSAVR